MKTIVISNQKGGCCKTSTAYALAKGLHNKGYNVLVIDADPQSNLTYAAGIDENGEQTLYDVLKGECSVSDIMKPKSKIPYFDVLSIGIQGTAADMELSSRTAREYMLKEAIDTISKDYEFCVIDTAPTLGLLTLNALTAADYAIIPLNLEIFSLKGMEQLSGFIENVRKYTNHDLKISGLLVTRYNERLNISQALKGSVEQSAKLLDTVPYETKIRESVAVRETQLIRGNLYDDAPKAAATKDYRKFVDEFLKREDLINGNQ